MAIEKNVNVIISATDKYSALMSNFGKNWKGIALGVIAAQAALVGFSIVMAKVAYSLGKDFVSSAVDFHDAIYNVEAVAQSFGTTGEQISDILTDMTIKFPLTGKAAGEALELIAQMGYGTEQQMRRMSDAAVTLQIATGTDLQIAAQGTMATMNAFGLEIGETERVMNLFAAAHFTSAASVSKLTEAMKYAAPAAKLVGMSVEDTTAMLALLINKGLEASQAGTTFRMAMAKVYKETDDGTEALASLGLTYKDLQGAIGNASKFIELFEGKTIGAKEAIAIFGVRAATMSLIINDGAEKFNKYRDSISNTTAALDAMEKKLKTWGVVTKMVEGDMDVLKKTIGMDLLKAIIDVVGLDEKSGIRGLITAIRELEEVQEGIGGPMVLAFKMLRDVSKDMFKDAFGDVEGFYKWLSNISELLSLNVLIVGEWTLAFSEVFVGVTKDEDALITFAKSINTSFGAFALTLAMVHDLAVGFFNIFSIGFHGLPALLGMAKEKFLEFALFINEKVVSKIPFYGDSDAYKKNIAELKAELLKTFDEVNARLEKMSPDLMYGKVIETIVKTAEMIEVAGTKFAELSKSIKGDWGLIADEVEAFFTADHSEMARNLERINEKLRTQADWWQDSRVKIGEAADEAWKFKGAIELMADGTRKVSAGMKEVDEDAKKIMESMKVLPDGTKSFSSALIVAKDKTKDLAVELEGVQYTIEGMTKKQQIQLNIDLFKQRLKDAEAATKRAHDMTKTNLVWSAKLDIAQVMAQAVKVKAIFGGIADTVQSAADASASMMGSFASADYEQGRFMKDIIEDQMKVQTKLADSQIRLTDAQTALMILQADTIKKDGMKISVSIQGDTTGWLSGLTESLFEAIFIKAEAEGFQCFGV